MKNIDTLCIQAGYEPKTGEPRVIPICQSTTYPYENADDMAACFDLKSSSYFYSRLANPTVSALENKMVEMDGGVAGIALSAGMTATMFAVMNVATAGDNIVSSKAIYGGSYNLFDVTLPKYGIETRFFDIDSSSEDIEKLIDEKTKVIFCETISNPSIKVLDFEKINKIAKKYNILFIVDNTLATPALCKPLELGANIVVYSTSKYIDGHACALGGVVIDGGNFEYKGNPRYNGLNLPDESYHGLIYSDLKNENGQCIGYAVKMRGQLIRDFGAIMSPMNAFLTNLGCETLALRMERHSQNAEKIAKFLSTQEKVEWVLHPSLEDNKYNALAKKYLQKGCGGMMSLGIKGGAEKAKQFTENLKMVCIQTHVADIRSCVLQPATTTHRQLSKEVLISSGIPENLVRLSVGCENVDDIIADLKQALDRL